jgi:hypothetical protein
LPIFVCEIIFKLVHEGPAIHLLLFAVFSKNRKRNRVCPLCHTQKYFNLGTLVGRHSQHNFKSVIQN